MDWQTFWAIEFWALVTLAATLATAISTSVTLLVRWRGRPEPDWAVQRNSGGGRSLVEGGPHTFEATFINAGDGHAFRVAALGAHCEAALQSEPLPDLMGHRRFEVPVVPLVSPGEEVHLSVACQLSDWCRAEIVIEWTAPPTRLGKRRSVRLPLREIKPAPESAEC